MLKPEIEALAARVEEAKNAATGNDREKKKIGLAVADEYYEELRIKAD